MAEANEETRILTIKDKDEPEKQYEVSQFSEEAMRVYNKLEVVQARNRQTQLTAEFEMECNQVLQEHFGDQLRTLLPPPVEGASDEEVIEDVEASEAVN